MNVKKQVIKSITEKLKQEQWRLRDKIRRNKSSMADLVEAQTINKRELAELECIIYSLNV